MLTVRTSENTVITSFRLISERQDFSSVRTGENTVRARARIQESKGKSPRSRQEQITAGLCGHTSESDADKGTTVRYSREEIEKRGFEEARGTPKEL